MLEIRPVLGYIKERKVYVNLYQSVHFNTSHYTYQQKISGAERWMNVTVVTLPLSAVHFYV